MKIKFFFSFYALRIVVVVGLIVLCRHFSRIDRELNVVDRKHCAHSIDPFGMFNEIVTHFELIVWIRIKLS